MMVNPTKRQRELQKMFLEEIAPYWMNYDEKLNPVLRDDAPEDIKKKYELFIKNSPYRNQFHY